jgi:hypothetical protein
MKAKGQNTPPNPQMEAVKNEKIEMAKLQQKNQTDKETIKVKQQGAGGQTAAA